MSIRDDRDVDLKGNHLAQMKIDFIVSGGIAALESPRMIRELRRYGADVRVFLTPTAKKFVSPVCFEWASKQAVVEELSGLAEHVSSADACIIAPCTLDFLAKISLGLADSAAATCVQSLLGRKPVLIQTSMHDSLMNSPSFERHFKNLKETRFVQFIEARFEEGKAKASEYEEFAAQVCHHLTRRDRRVLVLLGPTRSQIDDVRFVSNFSTGALGRHIAGEFFKRGWTVDAVAGPIEGEMPKFVSSIRINTSQEMKTATEEYLKNFSYDAIVFSAAVLDYEIENKQVGKRSSAESFTVSLKPSAKLIQKLGHEVPVRVGFKLESGISVESLKEKIRQASVQNACHLLVGNLLEQVDSSRHQAFIYEAANGDFTKLSTKTEIAICLVSKTESLLSQKTSAALKPKPSSSRSMTLV